MKLLMTMKKRKAGMSATKQRLKPPSAALSNRSRGNREFASRAREGSLQHGSVAARYRYIHGKEIGELCQAFRVRSKDAKPHEPEAFRSISRWMERIRAPLDKERKQGVWIFFEIQGSPMKYAAIETLA